MTEKVAALLQVRNEEKFVTKSLESLLNQELKPYRIIVINDGSTDKTKEIVTSSFPTVEIINNPVREESYLTKKELVHTRNLGLSQLHSDKQCQYVWLTDGDQVYSETYSKQIISRMRAESVIIASGTIKGEYSFEPRGGGRIIDWNFWKKIGMLYPVNYGYEAYLLLKARSMGYTVKAYPDIMFTTLRKTGKNYNLELYYNEGISCKILNYSPVYTLAKTLCLGIKRPRAGIELLRGYYSDYDDLYEPELREYVRKTQNKINFTFAKRFFNTLMHK